MDELARFNQQRWEALAKARILYSRPKLDLDAAGAREWLDEEGVLGEVAGMDVLCLAGGGGQQSAGFGLLGANVTVLDLTRTQLDRDHEAAEHYGLTIRTVQGDMRDLSCFEPDSFDLVWHAHSLSFVPDVRVVLDQVAGVLRPGGRYRLHWGNPFYHGLEEANWDGAGYSLRLPYVDGGEVTYADPHWVFADDAGRRQSVRGPREFRHSLQTVVNGLIARGFAIGGLWEGPIGDASAEPKSWEHFTAIAPPWLIVWARQQP